jgi:hypothetical protein
MEFSLNKLKNIDLDKFAERVREINSPEPESANGQALALVNLNLDTAKPRFAEYLGAVQKFESEAQVMEVKDDASREAAANLAGGAKKLIKAIDNRRLEVTKEAREFTSRVNAFVDKFTSRLKSAADLAGEKELQYVKLQEMKRREAEKLAQEATAKLQKQIDKEAKKKGIEPVQVLPPVVPETQTTARTEAGITSYLAKVWTFEIVDDSDVPRIYCSADPGKIGEAVKNGVRQIQGCRIFEKEGMRHR